MAIFPFCHAKERIVKDLYTFTCGYGILPPVGRLNDKTNGRLNDKTNPSLITNYCLFCYYAIEPPTISSNSFVMAC